MQDATVNWNSQLTRRKYRVTFILSLSDITNQKAIQKVGKFISLHIRSMWETICDAQAGSWLNSKFLSKFSRKPLSGISDQKAPLPPFRKTSDLRWPKFTLEYPLLILGKLQIWHDQSLLRITPHPHFRKLQIWDDQSLLQNTPPPFRKTSDLRWPKFTPEYLPPFRKMREIVCGD